MGKNMAEALGGSTAIVHRGHGTFMVGQSIEEVVISAASLERACKKQVLASSIGELLEYDEKEIRKTNTNEIRQEVTDIDWGYFTTRLSKFGMTG
jgi:ribulose-5-phosphate 4-epimerase/fuculose-1-phosphate aldolase